ncbi:MAG: hypothetical protein EXR99_09290 [Gemmataceae bacterium]|nr:hypothetical protein [Gemmataceae bacterium]
MALTVESLCNSQGNYHFGFLTINQEPTGYVGAYLLTNRWVRPLEFRISSAVQPNKVQQILYGDSLRSFLFADVIAKTLVEKSSTPATVILTDQPEVIGLANKLDVTVACLAKAESQAPEGTLTAVGPRGIGLHCFGTAETAELLSKMFEGMDIDLAEPFIRIRDAIQETRRIGPKTPAQAA